MEDINKVVGCGNHCLGLAGCLICGMSMCVLGNWTGFG